MDSFQFIIPSDLRELKTVYGELLQAFEWGSSRPTPNEKEISHGRALWQTLQIYIAVGPLASWAG
jgi:hypothetical protein